ncbi:hypothetical protein C8R46DRAFT_1232100 [Mycena filopes]|nr:hypothetical protein C8R46DRAFT_1232100 [Mycena filopes]
MSLPNASPLFPKDTDFDRGLRTLIAARHRVLFESEKHKKMLRALISAFRIIAFWREVYKNTRDYVGMPRNFRGVDDWI